MLANIIDICLQFNSNLPITFVLNSDVLVTFLLSLSIDASSSNIIDICVQFNSTANYIYT